MSGYLTFYFSLIGFLLQLKFYQDFLNVITIIDILIAKLKCGHITILIPLFLNP